MNKTLEAVTSTRMLCMSSAKEDDAMCDGESLGLIQMLMTPTGLAVTAAAAGALFLFARWVITDGKTGRAQV